MHCPSCGFATPEGMKFCGQCGAPLSLSCRNCGFVNPPGFAFCGQCGTALAEQTPTAVFPALASRSQAPRRYTPSYLAEKILTSRTALEGERKQVTVLFADLKGSMELLADRDPEEARQLLDPVLERMMVAVHRYEGTVNQVMGDGIMALFGAPLAHEDHAVRACYAALAVQASVKQYAGEVQRTRGVPLHIRVGLNSGEVVVRSIGSDLRMDYTAVGQTTHLAARMEQTATPGSVLITAQTLHLVEAWVQVKPVGPVPVRGVMAPVEVFELVGAVATRMHLQALADRELTQFVGRQAELEALRRSMEEAASGHGQIIAVIGEPGVGKTRLFYEFICSHRTQGWLVCESQAVSYGQAIAYRPIRDLLTAYFQIDEHDEVQKIRDKVTGKLATMETALGPTLPAFLSLLDLPVEHQLWQDLDPPQRRQHTREAIKHLLLRESQVQPVLLVIENLHWIDAETQACLDDLVESLPAARLLLLVNYRPEYRHGWGSKTYYTQLRLDPLSPASADALLQRLLGDNSSLVPLKRMLIGRTEGNPFFLEESVRTLVETGVLVGERGTYRLVKPLDSLQVPATVQAVLAARIDRLPSEEKNLLQTAAVIGTEVPWPLVQAIAEMPEDTLHRSVMHLQTAEFLYVKRLFPDHEYTFKHALTHEVAYNSLLQGRRRALHARIVGAIEALAGDRVAEQVERLAHHALRGEVWDKAVTYSRQAGEKAIARSAHREAVTYFEQALSALPHLPEHRETLEQAIDLRINLRHALFALGYHNQLLDHLREAEALAEALHDQRRLGRVVAFMTESFRTRGEAKRALAFGQRAFVIAETLGDFALQVETHHHLGRVYQTLGDYRQAIACFRWNVESLGEALLLERFGMPAPPAVFSRMWLVRSLAEVGAFAEGSRIGDEAIQIAEMVAQPWSQIGAYCGVGLLSLRQGHFHKAITMLERGLTLCQVMHIPLMFPLVASLLGSAYALTRQMGQALPLLEQAMEQTATTMGSEAAMQAACLGEAYLLADRLQDANTFAGQALEFARADGERGHQAHALRLLGDITAHRDPSERESGEAYYHQALALAEELGMRPLQAHCHYGLGTLYAKHGQREQARAELSAAIALYRAMDMTFWLPQAEATLARVG
jgi:class 3 adenylate cyclase/tetratricopeptide (TPR) repeat protein